MAWATKSADADVHRVCRPCQPPQPSQAAPGLHARLDYPAVRSARCRATGFARQTQAVPGDLAALEARPDLSTDANATTERSNDAIGSPTNNKQTNHRQRCADSTETRRGPRRESRCAHKRAVRIGLPRSPSSPSAPCAPSNPSGPVMPGLPRRPGKPGAGTWFACSVGLTPTFTIRGCVSTTCCNEVNVADCGAKRYSGGWDQWE